MDAMNQKLSGELVGEYRSMLAMKSSTKSHLHYVLTVGTCDEWSAAFEVKVGDHIDRVDSLAKAIRIYEAGA
jgi:hypothetical protein